MSGLFQDADWQEKFKRIKDPQNPTKNLFVNTIPIRCGGCGKQSVAIAIIHEPLPEPMSNGKMPDPHCVILPNPLVVHEWRFPEGWIQAISLTRNFFPYEMFHAIACGLKPFTAYQLWLKDNQDKYAEWTCCHECFDTVNDRHWWEFEQVSKLGIDSDNGHNQLKTEIKTEIEKT